MRTAVHDEADGVVFQRTAHSGTSSAKLILNEQSKIASKNLVKDSLGRIKSTGVPMEGPTMVVDSVRDGRGVDNVARDDGGAVRMLQHPFSQTRFPARWFTFRGSIIYRHHVLRKTNTQNAHQESSFLIPLQDRHYIGRITGNFKWMIIGTTIVIEYYSTSAPQRIQEED